MPSTILQNGYIDHAADPGEDNITTILQKHTIFATNKYHDLPYLI